LINKGKQGRNIVYLPTIPDFEGVSRIVLVNLQISWITVSNRSPSASLPHLPKGNPTEKISCVFNSDIQSDGLYTVDIHGKSPTVPPNFVSQISDFKTKKSAGVNNVLDC